MTAKQEDLNLEEILEVEAMNTSFYIKVMDCKNKDWKNIISGWFKYVEMEWSRFLQDNELYRLNQLNVGEHMILSPPLFDILQKAEEYRRKTKGLFSPYLLPQMQYHGYDQSFPFTSVLPKSSKLPGIYTQTESPFEFDHHFKRIIRLNPVTIDLGGIAKGYAVQSAAQWLKECGQARAGMVDGGGDMSVWSDGEKEWKIGVSHPFETNKEIAQFRMKNASAATSNLIYRSWQQAKVRKHHILNGKTGLPAESPIIQATVVCENLLDAEVTAKLCFMEDTTEIKKSINIYSFLLVDKTGKINLVR